MLKIMTQYWWAVTLRGVVAILFGIAAFLWSGITLQILIALFGAFVLLDGLFTLIIGINSRKIHQNWWAILLQGLIGIAIGVIAFAWPEITAVAMLYMIAVWAVLSGVLELTAGIQLRNEVKDAWLWGVSGAISILFGIALFIWPGAALLGMIWLIGAYAVLFGALLVYLGFKLRQLNGDLKQEPDQSRSYAGTPSSMPGD